MTTEGWFESWQVAAVDDWSQAAALHKVVNHDGTFAADYTRAAGVLKSKGKAGQLCRVAYLGAVKAFAGAAITTPGAPLTATTSGFLAVATHTQPYLGRLAATSAPCNSGDLVTILLGL